MPKTFLYSGGSTKAITEQSFPDGLFRQSDSSVADIDTLYNEVAWLRRSVDIIAQAVSNIPRSLHKGTSKADPLVSEDVLELDLSHNLDAFAADFVLHGAAYGAIIANRYNIPKRLVRYVPTSIEPKYSAATGLDSFVRTVNGVQYVYERDALMYCWAVNRKEEVGNNDGSVSAAKRAAQVLRNTARYYEGYYASGAVNPTIISISGDATDSDRERVASWFKRALTGIQKAFKVSVSSGDVKATTLGYMPKDLAAKELTDLQREDICTAIGVPKTLLFSDAATNATASNDSLMLYELTVMPLANRLAAALNKLLHKIGYHLELHPEQLEVYQRYEVEKANGMVALQTAGIMTTDEVRRYMGIDDEPKPSPSETAKASPDEDEDWYAQIDALKADIRRLGNVARGRLRENKMAKVRQFNSDVLPPSRLDALKERLVVCADNKAIDAVIGEALLLEPEWVGYG